MPRKGNIANLKPLKKGDPRTQELVAMSHAKRRENIEKRKSMKEAFDILLKIRLRRGEMAFPEDIKNLAEAKKLNISAEDAIAISMVERAILGDVQAATFIRDTVGEKPSDKVQVDQSLSIESWAKNHQPKL